MIKGTLGAPPPDRLAPNETYIEPAGQLMNRRTVDKIVRQAKAYAKAAPDKGKRVYGWRNMRGNEKPKGRKTRTVRIGKKQVRQVWTLTSDKSKKGQLDKDQALSPLAKKLPAFSDVLGFRCFPESLSWNTLLDKHLPDMAKKGDQLSVDKIEAIDAMTQAGCRRVRKRPNPDRRLPIVQTYESPLLTGF